MFISREISNMREFRNMVIDFFVELRNVHVLGLIKNANKLESIDSDNLERKAYLEVKARLKLERKKITANLDRKLQQTANEILSQ